MTNIESIDRGRSTWPRGIAAYREFEHLRRQHSDAVAMFVTVEASDDEAAISWLSKRVKRACDTEPAKIVVVLPFAHLSSRLAPPQKSRHLLDTLRSRLEQYGLSATRITFGTYKRLKWDVATSALTSSYVEFGSSPTPPLRGMIWRLTSLECRNRTVVYEAYSNLVALLYSASDSTAELFLPSVVDRLGFLNRQFYHAKRLAVIHIDLGGEGTTEINRRLGSSLISAAKAAGWDAFHPPCRDRIAFELAGHAADASYFEYPRGMDG